MKHAIGVDLGGTSLRVAVVDVTSGEIVQVSRMPTPVRGGPQAIIDAIVASVADLVNTCDLGDSAPASVGIGIPGLVDAERGVALLLPNIPGDWPNVALRAVLETRLKRPVRLINDVRAMTLAEWTFGAGRGVVTVACYAVGTGIGGGVIVNGRLHLGINGSAGELGHQVVELNGLPCNCGGRGCLETVASGPAIAAHGVLAVIQRRPTCIGAMVDFDLNRIKVEVILRAARDGDAVAQAIFAQAGAYIGMAVANTILTISPRKVVLGGGVAAAGDLLLDPIRRMVRERVFLVPAEQVEIVPAALGNDAGLIGAALWAAQW